MTTQHHSGDVPVADASDRAHHKKPGRRSAWLMQCGAMLGIAILVYSHAADWFAALGHNAEISGYVQQVEHLPDAQRAAMLDTAQEYNGQLPAGVLKDPYTNTADGTLDDDAQYQQYLATLGADDQQVIGELAYPKLGIGLPIYHGTDDAVLTKGVGHLYGSSLPVGGPSTHSVMTSHSGLVNTALFTKLPDAAVGDVFSVQVLGQHHYYQVQRLDTVLPHETEALEIVEGQDWVTLITCTPIGVNSHRLLVQAQRIPAPNDVDQHTLAGDGQTPGFPWWALWFVTGSAAAAVFIFSPPRHTKTSLITAEQKAEES